MKTLLNPMAPEHARANLVALGDNTYPGRVVIAGTAAQSPLTNPAHILITAIGGRSERSRNRRYVRKPDSSIWTDFVAPSNDDPTLVIYSAMDHHGKVDGTTSFVASNGDQTESILNLMYYNDTGHESALKRFQYEPDKPNYTPRISASLQTRTTSGPPEIILSRASKAPVGDYLEIPTIGKQHVASDCVRKSWSVPSMLGIGHMLCTYEDNGDPLPSYLGSPMSIPLEGAPEEMLTTIWNALNKDTRVAMCLRIIIDSVTGEFRTFIKNGDNDIVEV
jgi:hypothetical protein